MSLFEWQAPQICGKETCSRKTQFRACMAASNFGLCRAELLSWTT